MIELIKNARRERKWAKTERREYLIEITNRTKSKWCTGYTKRMRKISIYLNTYDKITGDEGEYLHTSAPSNIPLSQALAHMVPSKQLLKYIEQLNHKQRTMFGQKR